jgi:hypothetical protein
MVHISFTHLHLLLCPVAETARLQAPSSFMHLTSALSAHPHSSNSTSWASTALWTTLRDLVLATQFASETPLRAHYGALCPASPPIPSPAYSTSEVAYTARSVPTTGTRKASALTVTSFHGLFHDSSAPQAAARVVSGMGAP